MLLYYFFFVKQNEYFSPLLSLYNALILQDFVYILCRYIFVCLLKNNWRQMAKTLQKTLRQSSLQNDVNFKWDTQKQKWMKIF